MRGRCRERGKRHWPAALAGLWALLVITGAAAAHPGVSAVAIVKITPDGGVTVTVHFDALAFALDETPLRIADEPMYELIDGPDDELTAAFLTAKARFATLFELVADGQPVNVEIVEFPTGADARAWRIGHPGARLPMRMDIVARAALPPGTRRVSLRFPEVMADVIVTFDRPSVEPFSFPARPGELTPPTEANLPGSAKPGDGPGENDKQGAATVRGPRMSIVEVAWRYVRLGFTHIIPEGVDHALFVLGLFLLSPRFKTLVWPITAFTIAHSITLTLTTFHLVKMPVAIVEPTIAATIAFIAVENLVTKKVHPWRPAVAFAFGLVHGMGFASALGEIGLPTGQLVTGLVAFNVGVECGHLAVLACAALLLAWWGDKPWYRKAIAIPLSGLIGAIALVWVVQRVVGAV